MSSAAGGRVVEYIRGEDGRQRATGMAWVARCTQRDFRGVVLIVHGRRHRTLEGDRERGRTEEETSGGGRCRLHRGGLMPRLIKLAQEGGGGEAAS